MSFTKKFIISASFAAVFISCGDKPAPTSGEAPVAEVEGPSRDSAPKAAVEVKKIDSAKALAEVVLKDVSEGNPEILWKALPEDYQKDVKDSIAAYVATADKEIHEKAFGLTSKVANVIEAKKEYIITSLKEQTKQAEPGKEPVDFDALDKNWGDIVSLVKNLSASDLASLDKLKSLDPQNFLSTTGKDMLGSVVKLQGIFNADAPAGENIADLAKVLVKELDVKSDLTKLEFTNPLSKEVNVVDFVKIGESWLPKEMADSWKGKVSELKTQFGAGSEMSSQEKMQANMMMGAANGILDKLMGSKSQEEFDGTVKDSMGMIFGMMMQSSMSDSAQPTAAPIPALEVPEIEIPETPSIPKFGK